jgi:hypothetical protein
MPAKAFKELTPEERDIFESLDTPRKIQEFLESQIEYNLEEKGETCYSPRLVLRYRKAHCVEGAIFAAAALYYHGQLPLIGQVIANPKIDDDHVISLYKRFRCWGALSKSKYPYLAFREPIHRNLRELTLTYVETYYTYEKGIKSVRGYALPLNLAKFDSKGWVTSGKELFYIVKELFRIPTVKILTPGMVKNLRPVTKLAKDAGEVWIHKNGVMGYLIKQQNK